MLQPARRFRSSIRSTSNGSTTHTVSTSPFFEIGRTPYSRHVSCGKHATAAGSGVRRERSTGAAPLARPMASKNAASLIVSLDSNVSMTLPPLSRATPQSCSLTSPASTRTRRIFPEIRLMSRRAACEDFEFGRIADVAFGGLHRDPVASHELRERHRHGLHAHLAAGLDLRVDLVRLAVADER